MEYIFMKPSFFIMLIFLVCLYQINVYGDNDFLSLKDFQKQCISNFSNVLTDKDKNSGRCMLNSSNGFELSDTVNENNAYQFLLFGENNSVEASDKNVLRYAYNDNGTNYVRSKFFVYCKSLITDLYRKNTVRCYQNLSKYPETVTALDQTGYLQLPDSDN